MNMRRLMVRPQLMRPMMMAPASYFNFANFAEKPANMGKKRWDTLSKELNDRSRSRASALAA